MNRSTKPKGIACPSDIAASVKALLGSMPESAVATRLGVSRVTLARLAAEMTCHAGTIAQVRAALAAPVVADERQLELIAV